MARYGQALTDRVVAKRLPPESAAVEKVSREVGISVGTLERWRADALSGPTGERSWTGPVPIQWTPRGEERYPRAAGSVAGDEPESGRRWITRRGSRHGSSRAGRRQGAMPALFECRR